MDKKTVPTGLKQAFRERLKKHLSLPKKPLSSKFRKNQSNLRQKLASIAVRERESREKEVPDEFLKKSLVGLEEQDKEVYEKTLEVATQQILETGTGTEKQGGLRRLIMGTMFTQAVFKEKYFKWKEEYDLKVKMDPTFEMSEKDFVVEKGREFIVQNRDLIIKKRVEYQLDQFGSKNEDETEEAERREKLLQEVSAFVQSHEQGILTREVDLLQLRSEFLQIFLNNGHSEDEKEQIYKLFQEIIDDVEYARLVQEQLELTAEEMMNMSYLNLTDDEWEDSRLKALYENAEDDLKEIVEQMITPVFSPTGAVAAPELPYSSVRQIGNASGVHIRPVRIVGQEGRNLYMIDFPHLKNRYQPLMEITFSKGSRDLSQATYTIEDPDADPDASHKGRRLRDGKPTRAYRVQDLPSVMARIQLDYALHQIVKESGDSTLNPDYVNRNLKDDDLRNMSERLLGFQFTEKPLLPPHIRKCKNLMAVLMQPDGNFVDRIKKMKVALGNDKLLPHVKKILESQGSRVLTVSALIEEAELKRGGVEIA